MTKNKENNNNKLRKMIFFLYLRIFSYCFWETPLKGALMGGRVSYEKGNEWECCEGKDGWTDGL